jgi:MFS family permease
VRPAGSIRRDLNLSLADAVGYGVMAGVAEVYIPAFGLALDMPPVAAGLLASVPLVAGGVLQLLAPRAIQRVRSIRSWVVACSLLQALAFVPLALMALFRTHVIGAVFASAALYWAAGMGQTAGWMPWMVRVVPGRIRSRFFARRLGLVQAAMLVGLVGAGLTLNAFSGTGHTLDIYAAMFGVAMIARLGSALAIVRQGPGVDGSPLPNRLKLRHLRAKLRRSPRTPLLGYLIAALAAAAVAGPFITPYLLDHERLDYLQYSAFTGSILVVKVIALPTLGRVVQRVGTRRVLTISALAIAPIPLMWFVSEQFVWYLVIQLYSGLAWAGFELGMLMALFDADDDAERTAMQVAFSALQAIGTASASVLGGVVLGAFGSGRDAYLAVFVVSSVARFLAAMVIVRRLPSLIARLPIRVVARAWTLAIRPWNSMVRPITTLTKHFRDRD